NVETTYTPKAAVEAAGDNAEPSTPDVAGEMDGKQDTSGNGGTDPTNPETIDEILGGSSGGCDAGFGALALALAATLFVSKKRS
ncbi:MAG: SYNERG-CTERM sorting domain-containing protein, partial [Synergistaceae bacterium]|nr:SYNERG-CTERM sorting domain-containing protein [Synergistaceae bacterium]